MNLRTLKRRHDAATARHIERAADQQAYSEFMHAQAALEDEFDDSDDYRRDLTCSHCSGTGGDPWNDGILPCEHCDGEGYEWWK